MRSLLGNEFIFSTNCTDDREGRERAILQSRIDSNTRFDILSLNRTLSAVESLSWLHSHSAAQFKIVNTSHRTDSNLSIVNTSQCHANVVLNLPVLTIMVFHSKSLGLLISLHPFHLLEHSDWHISFHLMIVLRRSLRSLLPPMLRTISPHHSYPSK
jgi:hypothetical protein